MANSNASENRNTGNRNTSEKSSILNEELNNKELDSSIKNDSIKKDNTVSKKASDKSTGKKVVHCLMNKEFTAKDVQAILRELTGGAEKIGLALLNYYSRTNLVSATGLNKHRGRNKYTYSDLILLCWLFRMKREGLPVNRFRKGIDYLRKKLPKLHKNPADMIMLTDGRNLFLKHRIEDKNQIAEVLTGNKTGQYMWMYAIGNLIEEVDQILDDYVEEDRVAA